MPDYTMAQALLPASQLQVVIIHDNNVYMMKMYAADGGDEWQTHLCKQADSCTAAPASHHPLLTTTF